MRATTGINMRTGIWMVAFIALVLPALTSGDTLRLVDGSVLQGKVTAYSADTLRFRTSFGSDVVVARGQIASLEFTDSNGVAQGAVPLVPAAAAAAAAASSGWGSIAVTFKDRGVSSKVIVEKKKNEAALLRANWILELLIVDGDTAFAYVDSVVDKTIYQGPDRTYRNDIELKDMYVDLPAGARNITVVVRNVGIEDWAEHFDGEPINMEFVIGDVEVHRDRESRVHLGMERGKLRMKKPRFYRVE